MLFGINPILGPDLLAILRGMGHGDEIAIVDGNYPALTDAKRLIRADGLNVPPVVDAILSLLPIDEAVPKAIFRSVNSKTPDVANPAHIEMEEICAKRAPNQKVYPLPPAEFYARVKAAHAIVATSDPRFYANIILRKGVIGY